MSLHVTGGYYYAKFDTELVHLLDHPGVEPPRYRAKPVIGLILSSHQPERPLRFSLAILSIWLLSHRTKWHVKWTSTVLNKSVKQVVNKLTKKF